MPRHQRAYHHLQLRRLRRSSGLYRSICARNVHYHPLGHYLAVSRLEVSHVIKTNRLEYRALLNVFRVSMLAASVAVELGALFVLWMFWLAIGAYVGLFYVHHDFS
jgi:hypothetical protein